MLTDADKNEEDKKNALWIRNVVIRRGFYINMICSFWNLVGDLIYSPYTVTGAEFLSSQLPDIINHTPRSHTLLLIAQTAGWMYPLWGVVTSFQLYIGLGAAGAGFYQSTLPCMLLGYSFCVIGGAQHSGWAFLTVLWQSPYAANCYEDDAVCRPFFDDVQGRIWRHLIMGDLPALLIVVSSLWIMVSIAINRPKTLFPWWFNATNPLVTQIWVFGVVYFLPPPYAGIVGGPVGTWVIFVTNIACAWCLWNYNSSDDKQNMAIRATPKKSE